MAFGRSNSLSINTGATNSIFAQQQQSNPSSQPPAAGGLFGSSTQQSTAAGSLFGGPAAQQQPPTGGGGPFGSSTAQPQQQNASLFTSQPQQTSSPFGSTQPNAQATQTGGSSLFGSALNQPAQQQQSNSLFGNTQAKPASSLFGTSTTQAPASGSSLFGGSTLFGGSNAQPQTSQPGMFGSQTPQQQQQNSSNSIFGLSAHAPQAPTSLLGASQYRSSQYQPFAGKLTMGQTASAAGVQAPVQGAVKINYDEMRPTTRFADCVEEIRAQLESLDTMIQNQERFCREIESFIPNHGANVASLAPDVTLIREKVETAENALALDAGGVESQRKILENDKRDHQRCERVVINLAQPLQYRYTGYNASHPSTGADGDVAKEMDLVGNYFVPMAADLKRTLDTHAANLAEIEGHMRVIEHSTVAQAQHLASRRAGVGGAGPSSSSDETVRELADTLRSFESSILGAAGLVGQCREGVNELVLGKLGRGVMGTR